MGRKVIILSICDDDLDRMLSQLLKQETPSGLYVGGMNRLIYMSRAMQDVILRSSLHGGRAHGYP